MIARTWITVACGAIAWVGCTDNGPVAPRPEAMTYYGCETDPNCSGGGGGGGGGGFASDPHPAAAGYWMGTTVTPSTCISLSGAGINDADYDALNDYCENLLAWKFRPAMTFSAYDCNTGMEPYWAAKVFPNQGNIVRIAYLFSYYWDCGAPDKDSFLCTLQRLGGNLGTLVGLLPDYSIGIIPVSSEDLCASHQGDSEFVLEDLAYDATSQHWYVKRTFFSAHWGTDGDHSRWTGTSGLEYPEKFGGYPRVWSAEGKHANYPTRYTCSHDGGLMDTCDNNPDGGTQIRRPDCYRTCPSDRRRGCRCSASDNWRACPRRSTRADIRRTSRGTQGPMFRSSANDRRRYPSARRRTSVSRTSAGWSRRRRDPRARTPSRPDGWRTGLPMRPG